jgi:hypothetical protein
VLNVEGFRARVPSAGARGPEALLSWALLRLRLVMLPGALLLLLSLLQGEFDYGVPQFRLVFHPMIVLLAAGVGLVAARVFLGRGAALGGTIVFLVIRGGIALLVGPVLGEPDHVFPLYLAEAAIVELVALRVPTRRPLRYGLVCGALIGTVGLAAEWAWSGVFPIPWPDTLLPEALLLAGAMAVAGSVLGAWLGTHLRVDPVPHDPALRRAAIAACVVITGLIGYGLIEPAPDAVRATVTLQDVTPPPDRTVTATVRLSPRDAADGADVVHTIAWQGGGFQTDALKEIAPGVWRTTKPVPVYGEWKSAVRLMQGGRLSALPLFLPADDAIPVTEVSAPARFTRDFADEGIVLRREAKDVPGWLWTFGTAVVAAMMFALLYVWAIALHRLAGVVPEPRAERAPRAMEVVA